MQQFDDHGGPQAEQRAVPGAAARCSRNIAKRCTWVMRSAVTRHFWWSLLAVIAIMGLCELLGRSLTVQPVDWASVELGYQLPRVADRGLLPYDQGAAGAYNFVLDIHAHTTMSDGQLTPAQLVDYAVSEGLDGIAVTDHQTIAGSLAAREYAEAHYPGKLVVLNSLEYTCCRCHLNLVGIYSPAAYEYIVGLIKPWPTDSELATVIAATHAAGGIAIVNHIPWSTHVQNTRNAPTLPQHPTLPQFASWGADAVEVSNSATFDLQSALWARQSGLMSLVGGSDTHVPWGHYGYTALNLSQANLTATDPIQVLVGSPTCTRRWLACAASSL
jgi:hypothetical protein